MASLTEIKPGVRFRHYKDKEYEIICLATDEASEERVVVYKALYGDHSVWVRKADSFCSDVVVEGNEIPRFRLITS